MSTGKAVGGLVAITLVLGGGLVAADRFAASYAQDYARDAVNSQLKAKGETHVDVHGFPFLTHAIGGTLDEVTVTVPAATVNDLPVSDVAVDARQVKVDAFSTQRHPTAGDVVVQATIPVASLQSAVKKQSNLDVSLSVEGSVLRATGTILGLSLKAAVTPRVQTGKLLVGISDVTLGDRAVSVDSFPALHDALSGITVPIQGLPAGMSLTGAQVVPTGVRVTASGTNVALPVS
ncbi:DUF2993 domain-containing protein [Lapillicoccus sp.]|uniref:LmeA family phospholipid-binding protein n=1 Tax=Lapillicoccus sp. TaxID=1909287 RepID=UPI00326544AD